MQRQPFVNFVLAGLSLTDFGLEIPSPFSSLELSNSEITSMTSWTLKCVVGGDANRKMNIAAFEALLYSAAQKAWDTTHASGIPVSFMFGWLNASGTVDEYVSYQGATLKFSVSTSGLYMVYTIEGWANLALPSSMPVLRIPEVKGIIQPSALVEAVAESAKATSYYSLDIDHNDAPTMIEHGALTTSFNAYIRGTKSGNEDYDVFSGLLPLSKSYNSSRQAGGLVYPQRLLSAVLNNVKSSQSVSTYLELGLNDGTPQCSSFSYWVDEPTMTQPGVIHYKSNAGLLGAQGLDVLQYGTANTNILNLDGSYNGISYNMTDMNFSQLGFALDGSGNSILDTASVVNSWSASLANVFQTANIINDVNALASQFSGNFTVTIPGSVKKFTVAQPISLVVVSGNTLSPITGVYNIISVSHTVNVQFITTLKIQRLTVSSANATASAQNIFVSGSSNYKHNSYSTTPNIKSPYKADLGTIYPTFEHMDLSFASGGRSF